jgi:hypothetical protein
VERTLTTFFSEESNPPPTANVAVQVPSAPSGSGSALSAGSGAGLLYDTNWFQSHSVPASLGYSAFSEPIGASGTTAQGWQFPPPLAPGVAASPPIAELRSLGQNAILPLLRPPLELVPQGPQEALFPQAKLSALKAGLLQFLGAIGPPGQQSVSFPASDLSALESGLLQFLADLSETGSQIVGSCDGLTLQMWLFAAAAAGAACAIAYRQQRRIAAACAPVVPSLPGSSPEDA